MSFSWCMHSSIATNTLTFTLQLNYMLSCQCIVATFLYKWRLYFSIRMAWVILDPSCRIVANVVDKLILEPLCVVIINNHYIEFPWELWIIIFCCGVYIVLLWSNNFISFACMNLHIIHAKRKWKHKHDTYRWCEETKYEKLNQWHHLQNIKWL